MKALRWLDTLLTTAIWAFLLAGGVGLAEGCLQWLRFDVFGDGPGQLGVLRLLLPTLTFSGWCGAAAAVLFFIPCSFAARNLAACEYSGRRNALAATLASVSTVLADYLLWQHLGWWDVVERPAWSWLVLLCVWLALAFACRAALGPLIRAIGRWRRTHLVFPVMLIIVATSLWPDWRAEGLQRRTGHLDRGGEALAPGDDAPNLVIITVDTWRADRLSMLEAESPPTPNLDAFAAEAIVYEGAWASSPWTLPSMATLMSGLPPRVLGCGRSKPLPAEAPLLGEIAWREGYRTAAFCTNAFVSEYFGFDRGFGFFEHASVLETLLPVSRSVLARQAETFILHNFDFDGAESVVAKSIGWLWQRGGRGPFCLWVHLLDPHLPYDWRILPPDPLAPAAVNGVAPRRDEVPDREYFAGASFSALEEAREGLVAIDEAGLRGMTALYDREVQYTDYWIGVLLRELKRLGHYDNSVIVFVGDHGEEFFEHGGYEHGHGVVPPVTRVPLMLRLPAGRDGGLRVEAPISTIDLMPTVAEALGWRPLDHWPGAVLTPLAAGRDSEGDVLITENLLYGPPQRGVVAWPWLRIDDLEGGASTWLRLDGDEGAGATVPEAVADRVQASVDSTFAHWDSCGAALDLDPEQPAETLPAPLRRELRALGY